MHNVNIIQIKKQRRIMQVW